MLAQKFRLPLVFGEGESTAGLQLPLCVGMFCLPWHRHSRYQDSRFYTSVWGNQSKVTCPRLQASWSETGIKPMMFKSRIRRLNHQTTPSLLITSHHNIPMRVYRMCICRYFWPRLYKESERIVFWHPINLEKPWDIHHLIFYLNSFKFCEKICMAFAFIW
jgi:hypothetical protein